MSTCPPYFTTLLDQALFAAAETLIQPPSGEPLPPLTAGRLRYVLARNGLFVQTRTAALEASLPLATLPDGLPYGLAAGRVARVLAFQGLQSLSSRRDAACSN